MAGSRDDQTKPSQPETERQIPYYIIYIWNLKYNTNKRIYKRDTDLQTWRADLGLPVEEGSKGGKDWEFGVSRYRLLYIGWINNKRLLYSTGDYIQHPMVLY